MFLYLDFYDKPLELSEHRIVLS